MIIEFDSSFTKSLSKLLDANLKLKIREIIEEATAANKLAEIKNVKKMKGYKTYYRIKSGDYRIGFELVDNTTVYFIIVAHRKDIYNIFP